MDKKGELIAGVLGTALVLAVVGGAGVLVYCNANPDDGKVSVTNGTLEAVVAQIREMDETKLGFDFDTDLEISAFKTARFTVQDDKNYFQAIGSELGTGVQYRYLYLLSNEDTEKYADLLKTLKSGSTFVTESEQVENLYSWDKNTYNMILEIMKNNTPVEIAKAEAEGEKFVTLASGLENPANINYTVYDVNQTKTGELSVSNYQMQSSGLNEYQL